jgi:hypothetical protein
MMNESQKFNHFMKGGAKHVALVKKYAKCHCGMRGGGKMSRKMLSQSVVQAGGSWGSFTNWVKGAANTVGNAVKKGANTVYNGAVKPAWNYVKSKPLTAIGQVAGVAGMIPSPFSGPLKAVGAAAGTVGRLTGTGGRKKLMNF